MSMTHTKIDAQESLTATTSGVDITGPTGSVQSYFLTIRNVGSYTVGLRLNGSSVTSANCGWTVPAGETHTTPVLRKGDAYELVSETGDCACKVTRWVVTGEM